MPYPAFLENPRKLTLNVEGETIDDAHIWARGQARDRGQQTSLSTLVSEWLRKQIAEDKAARPEAYRSSSHLSLLRPAVTEACPEVPGILAASRSLETFDAVPAGGERKKLLESIPAMLPARLAARAQEIVSSPERAATRRDQLLDLLNGELKNPARQGRPTDGVALLAASAGMHDAAKVRKGEGK